MEGSRYDLVLDTAGELYRAQIKYANRAPSHASGAIQVSLKSTVGQGAARCYTADEVDALSVYLPRVDRVCFFPQEVFCGMSGFNIRLEPTRNGQSKGCVPAEKFFW